MEKALKGLEKTIAAGEQLGSALLGADWLTAIRAFIALGEGNYNEACELAESAISFARRVGGIMAEGLAERALGHALLLSGHNMLDASEHFAASVRLLESGDARLEAARTHQLWGTVLCEQADVPSAQAHLELALAQFRAAGLAWNTGCL